jgi:hypothetical protein
VELRSAQLGDHGGLPARQVIHDEHQVRLVFGAHDRPRVGAVLLATPDIETCGIARSHVAVIVLPTGLFDPPATVGVAGFC